MEFVSVEDIVVGNWFLIDGFVRQFEVSDFDNSNYQICEPILLTEEILLDAGFEYEEIQTKNNRPPEKLLCNFPLIMNVTSQGHYCMYPFGYPVHPNRGIYVHQAQNMYYFLTGKILKFDLNKLY